MINSQSPVNKNLFTEESTTALSPEMTVRAIIEANVRMLEMEMTPATSDTAAYRKLVDGKPTIAHPINLYVERPTGKIIAVTSIEKERREQAHDIGKFIVSPLHDGRIAPIATYDSNAVFGDISKVPVWYQSAWPLLGKDVKHPENKTLVDRPDSWTKNSHIIPFDERQQVDITKLLPDPLNRGVFLKSLEKYNQGQEPPYVDGI